jgi:MFS family permease
MVFQDGNTIFYFCLLLGLSFGIGLPSCFAALADLTLIEERGRISGLVQFSTFLSLVLLVLVPSMLSFGVREYQILSLILRILSFAALLLEPFYRISGKGISFPKILRKREFLFYTIPWLMFNLSNGVLEIINSIFRPNPAYKIVFELSPFVLYLGALIFGLISGIIADRSGRKQPIILGFIVLGISYALIGITSTPQSWFTMIALSGVGWGFIMVVYLWTILGDIAPIGGREKFYAIGFVIPTLTETIFEFVANKIYLDVNISYVSTVLSIFLFLSVFPLILAKETLPEEKMSDRRLRDYLIKARERLRESEEKS